ncbi:four helix bundle protein [Bacteroides sp. 224]|uniref:four helix bundle protein n=1 Tax=Bacteroides sp. 224 TaxID=2302936 RepID=UPI0013D11269|nr:four helix bundle protein [Bacteroides sp. 224]NDV66416.1 four helix bundle protein [Bacteroides sp. 224]
MAPYSNLPVYKAIYDLLLLVFKDSFNLQREYRYTIGEKLKSELTELVMLVYRANATKEKNIFIQEARERVELVKLNFRILHDLKQISLKQYVRYAEMAEGISKQLAAWQKYVNS